MIIAKTEEKKDMVQIRVTKPKAIGGLKSENVIQDMELALSLLN